MKLARTTRSALPLIVVLAAFVAAGIGILRWTDSRTPGTEDEGIDLAAVLGSGDQGPRAAQADGAGYAVADRPRAFDFPRDHGPHPGFRSEWWYFTGNLEDSGGRRFGYQWVVFRLALSPKAGTRASAWATNQAYMAHFAITDPEGRRHRHFERFARGAAGLAGARAAPLRVWLEDWKLEEAADGAWRLEAGEEDIALELTLRQSKPVVLNGEAGLSRKSPGAGNASYYYSISRFDTHGILRIAGTSHAVSGLSWLDREWSTSALAEDQAGWDWFALQLDDGTDLMFYQLRRKDGTIDPFSTGTFIDRAGRYYPVDADAVELEVLDTWTSPRGGSYPSGWRLRMPERELALEIRPALPDQELDVSLRYWEGAVDVTGSAGSRPVAGRGYVELVGYGETAP